jgi:AraC-like DNA-binding protein
MGRKRKLFQPGEVVNGFTVVRRTPNIHNGSASRFRCRCGKEFVDLNSIVRRQPESRCPKCRRKPGGARRPKKVVRNNLIIERRKQGAGLNELSREFGISRERVCQLLRPHNLANLYRLPDEGRLNKLKELIPAGKILTELAAELGCSVQNVYYLIKSNGLMTLWKSAAKLRKSRTREIRDQKFNEKWTGYDFGPNNRLTFVRRDIGDMCWFRCSCGNEHRADLRNVKSGFTKSCGCMKEEYARSLLLGFCWNKNTGQMTNVSGSPVHDSHRLERVSV